MFEYKFVAGEMVTITKKQWLSKISTIFDPMGFVAPFIVQARILTQRMWVKGYEWDEKIEGDIETACRNWLNEICCLSEIKMSRWLGFNQHVVDTEFHVFVDASGDAYGAVCYVRRVYVDKSVKICFVLSRGRVAPLKCMTVPKLELMAAVVGLKVGKIVSVAMNCSLKCFYFWSDSMNVLWWIRGYSRSFKPFVAHRIGQTQSNTSPDQWNYVNTERNPADIISRGSNVRYLKTNSLWLNGPHYLHLDKSEWPKT